MSAEAHPLRLLAILLALFPAVCPAPAGAEEKAAADFKDYAITWMFNQDYRMLVAENEPIARAHPRNPDKYFKALLRSAKKSVDLCMFDIDDPDMVTAFIAVKKRGVPVRMVTESDNLRDKEDPERRRTAMTRLKRAGIPIHDDERSALMHDKFMVVDGKTVWVGSLNLTSTSLYAHNNNALMIRSKKLAANFESEFNRLFVAGDFGGSDHVVPYPEVTVDGARVRTFFSPRGGTREAILKVLRAAKKSIYFMAFSFTDEEMGEVMAEKHKAGLDVEGVFDGCLLDRYSQSDFLRAAHVPVWRDGNQALLHHKVMIIDGKTVVTGSYNFSASAELHNNESCVIIESPKVAEAYLNEFKKIRHAARTHHRIPPYDHPACRH